MATKLAAKIQGLNIFYFSNTMVAIFLLCCFVFNIQNYSRVSWWHHKGARVASSMVSWWHHKGARMASSMVASQGSHGGITRVPIWHHKGIMVAS